MNNAERILTTLDRELDHPVELVLFGRAAIALGFDAAPDEVGRSLDVDVLLPRDWVAALDRDDQFWRAQEATNLKLHRSGLYITHLFTEDQVFIRPGWLAEIVPINKLPTRWLKLSRPSTIDLILTKMMRGADEVDSADLKFLIHHDRVTVAQLSEAMSEVVIPDLPEFRELFEQARPVVLELAAANEGKH